jgi:hypothetical protein
MEDILREPVELTEFELDAVAGGNPFSNTGAAGLGSLTQVTSSQGFVGIDATALANVITAQVGLFVA